MSRGVIFIKGVLVRPGYQRAAAGVVSVLLAGGAISAIALHPKHSTAAPAAETPPTMFQTEPVAQAVPGPEWDSESGSRYISLSARVRYASTVGAASRLKTAEHVVLEGDSFWSIAAANGTDTATLMDLNPSISAHELRPGQVLRVIPNFRGISHSVQSGDTLFELAAAYGTTVEQIQTANDIEDETSIQVNQSLLIPGVHPRSTAVSRGDFVRSSSPSVPVSPTVARTSVQNSDWQWPIVGGRITTQFSASHGGIDIAVPSGTKVHAAKSGSVVFAGWDGGYGYCVILDHGDGYLTRYAHASALLVRVGTKVSQGDPITLVGSTGHSTGPHLHFEITVDGTPKNPWNYLK